MICKDIVPPLCVSAEKMIYKHVFRTTLYMKVGNCLCVQRALRAKVRITKIPEAPGSISKKQEYLEAFRVETLPGERGEKHRGAGASCRGAPMLRGDQAFEEESESKWPISLPAPCWL